MDLAGIDLSRIVVVVGPMFAGPMFAASLYVPVPALPYVICGGVSVLAAGLAAKRLVVK